MTTPPDLGALPFTTPRDAGGVLNATFAFVRATARPLLVGYLCIVGPVALAGGLATALFFRSFSSAFSLDPATAMPEDVAGIFGPTYFGTILFSFLTLATTLAFGAAVVRRYRDGTPPEALTVGALWDETRGLILPALGMMLAFGLAAVLSAVINVVPCLGTLAWMAGMVWLSPYLHVAFAVRMVEGGTLAEAVARARALVTGRWGLAGGAVLLIWLVTFVVTSALSLPLYAVMMLVGFNAAEDPMAIFTTMGYVVGPLQVLTTAVYLLPTIAAFFVHGSLTERQDGGGLWADLDRLGGTPTPPVAPMSAPPAAPLPEAPRADDGGDLSDGDPSDGDPPEAPPPSGFRGGGFGEGS